MDFSKKIIDVNSVNKLQKSKATFNYLVYAFRQYVDTPDIE